MQTLEALQRQMASAADLHTVVKTMKTLAAVNIRQYEQAVEALAVYNRTVTLGLHVLLSHRPAPVGRAAAPPDSRLGALVFGSDQGMCGALNEQIVAHALQAMDVLGAAPEARTIAVVGARVAAHFEAVGQPLAACFAVPGALTGITPLVQDLVLHLESWHRHRHLERLYLFYSQPLAGAAFRPHTVQLWPAQQAWHSLLAMDAWPSRVLPTFTMDWERLFAALMRQYLFVALHRACAESLASEHASRLAAMQRAEKNINERLAELQAQFRQQRQQAITAELLDIVAGFEALTQE